MRDARQNVTNPHCEGFVRLRFSTKETRAVTGKSKERTKQRKAADTGAEGQENVNGVASLTCSQVMLHVIALSQGCGSILLPPEHLETDEPSKGDGNEIQTTRWEV